MYRSRLGTALAGQHVHGLIAHVATGLVAAADIAWLLHVGGVAYSEIGAAHSAFVSAMDTGMQVAAAVALVSAVGAIFALPRRRQPQPAPHPPGRACPGPGRLTWKLMPSQPPGRARADYLSGGTARS